MQSKLNSEIQVLGLLRRQDRRSDPTSKEAKTQLHLSSKVHPSVISELPTSKPNAFRTTGSIVRLGTRIMTSSFRARHGFATRLDENGTNEIGLQQRRFQCIVNNSWTDPVSVE